MAQLECLCDVLPEQRVVEEEMHRGPNTLDPDLDVDVIEPVWCSGDRLG